MRHSTGGRSMKVMVFIHGLYGGEETWGRTPTFLGDLLGPEWEVAKFSYRSKPRGGNPSIPEIATQLEYWLNDNFSDAEGVFMAGHSMGGLVAKEYVLSILRRSKADELRVKTIVLAAVPNSGSEAAKIASKIPLIDGSQIEGLRPPRRKRWFKRFGGRNYEPTFVELQQRDWAARINTTVDYVKAAGRANIDVHVLYAVNDQYVDPESARGLFPDAVPVAGDHRSIVKPGSPDDPIVSTISGWILRLPEDEPPVPPKYLPTGRIHYIEPSRALSIHYARLELRVRQAFYAQRISVEHHILAGETANDSLDLFKRLSTQVPVKEPIALVPRDFASIEGELAEEIARDPNRHVLFLDQEPPESLLDLPNVSYVGPDNWLVGCLAAMALEAHFKYFEHSGASVLGIDGPGGPKRADGFQKTVNRAVGLQGLKMISIPDQDRFDTATIVRDLVREHPEVDGFFAGNDETAAAFLEAMQAYEHGGVVVGCDGTREMRQLALRGGTPLINTVLTYPEEQALEVARLCSKNLVGSKRYRQPSLERYQHRVQKIAESEPKLRALWPPHEAKWRDHPTASPEVA